MTVMFCKICGELLWDLQFLAVNFFLRFLLLEVEKNHCYQKKAVKNITAKKWKSYQKITTKLTAIITTQSTLEGLKPIALRNHFVYRRILYTQIFRSEKMNFFTFSCHINIFCLWMYMFFRKNFCAFIPFFSPEPAPKLVFVEINIGSKYSFSQKWEEFTEIPSMVWFKTTPWIDCNPLTFKYF